jgi:hypothetical protein
MAIGYRAAHLQPMAYGLWPIFGTSHRSPIANTLIASRFPPAPATVRVQMNLDHGRRVVLGNEADASREPNPRRHRRRVAQRDERIQDREIGRRRRCARGARIRIFRADRLDEDDVLAGERLARPMAKKPMFIDSTQTSEKR